MEKIIQFNTIMCLYFGCTSRVDLICFVIISSLIIILKAYDIPRLDNLSVKIVCWLNDVTANISRPYNFIRGTYLVDRKVCLKWKDRFLKDIIPIVLFCVHYSFYFCAREKHILIHENVNDSNIRKNWNKIYKLIIENLSDESHSSRKLDHLSETELVTLIEFIRSKIKTFNNTLQLRFSLQ